MNLRTKMIVLISVPVAITLIALSFFAYRQASTALDHEIRNRSIFYTTAYYSEHIASLLAEKEAVLTTLTAELSVRPVAEPELGALLSSVIKNTPGVMDIYVAYADRRFVDGTGWIPPNEFDARDRGWYKAAAEKGDPQYSEVYIDAITKQPIISISKAFRVNGAVAGVIGMDLNLKAISEAAAAIKVGETGNAFIINSQGHYVYHPTLKLEDNIFKLQNGAFAEAGKRFLSGQPTFDEFSFGGIDKLYAARPIGKTGWALVVNVPRQEVFASISTLGRTVSVVSVVALLLIGALIWFIAQNIAKSVNQATAHLDIMAKGDFTLDVPPDYLERKDEFGMMAKSFNSMTQNMRGLVQQIQRNAEQVAASSEQLTASADQSALAANQVAVSITEVANGVEAQLAASKESADIVAGMSNGIQQTAQRASQVTARSAQAADKARNGAALVTKAVTQMTQVEKTVNTSAGVVAKLGDRSKEIGQIVDTISGIAGQTNLLALNAAIEAARAGEQGRGFAVVAEEVRRLAEQSQDAAKQIAQLIQEIQGETDMAVTAMSDGTREVKLGAAVVNDAGQAFQEINTLITEVSSQVKEISLSIDQLAHGSSNIVSSVRRIDDLNQRAAEEAQTVSAATEEQSASMQEIAASSQALAKLAQDLQSAISQFTI